MGTDRSKKIKQRVNVRISPFMFDRRVRRNLSKSEEGAEVLASAFHKASKGFFENRFKLEHDISNTYKTRDAADQLFKGLLAFGILVLVAGVALIFDVNLRMGGAFLAIVGAILLALAFMKYSEMTRSQERIQQLVTSLNAIVPEKRITFASKMFLPVYILPFSQGEGILVDAMDRGEEQNYSLVTLDEEKIREAHSKFKKELEWVIETSKTTPILGVGEIEEFKPDLTSQEHPEKDLFSALNELGECYSSSNWKRKTVETSTHKPDSSMGKCVNFLHQRSQRGRLPKQSGIRSIVSLQDAHNGVQNISKIKKLTIDEELSTTLTDFKDDLGEIIRPLEERYKRTIQVLANHQEVYNLVSSDMRSEQVCGECMEIKEIEPLSERYDLGHYIMEKFSASIEAMDGSDKCMKCGYALNIAESKQENCPDCGHRRATVHPYPSSPQDKAERMIKENIRADLKDIPMQQTLGLERLRRVNDERWKCTVHGFTSEPELFRPYNEVMAYTAKNLWEEMERPIREKADKANEIVTRNRQKFNDQILALLPYDQLMQELEIERNRMQYNIEGARGLIEAGGGE